MSATDIEPGDLVRHYKGGLYSIVKRATLVARGSSASTPVVVYRSVDSGQTYVRDEDEFYDTVPALDGGEPRLRFTHVRYAPELLP
jgi:hypothetical protein